MGRAFHTSERLHMMPERIAMDIKRKKARVAQQCKAIEQQFFTGQPCLLASGKFAINGRHYA